MVKLNRANLPSIRKDVQTPNYRPDEIAPGILHIGVGNYHRAHQALYLDTLFNQGKSRDWAIVGTGVRDADRKMYDALRDQDYLTTVVEQEADFSRARVTGSMIDFVPPEDRTAIVARMADPAIRIVSMTITEGGYFIDPATGVFNPEFQEIVDDKSHPHDPKTPFGLIALALKKRKQAGIKPFTVMSCDNIPHNGVVTRNAVVGVARLWDEDLARWIEDHTTFPNAMVDRIVPATTDRERKMLSATFGVSDNWPVFCEEYIQWVIDGEFPTGRPAWEDVGVQFVSDVTPFEFMKIRILNGGHAAIAYAGSLLDVHFVHDAMAHPLIGAFFRKIETGEIVPTVPPVPGVNLEDYYELIRRRFSNPKIGDTIPRLAFDGSNRQPKFIIPVIRDQMKAGRSIDALAFESALWCRHCFGTTDSGREITAGDPNWERLRALAAEARHNPSLWLAMEDVYGDLAQSSTLQTSFAQHLNTLWAKGTSAAMAEFVKG